MEEMMKLEFRGSKTKRDNTKSANDEAFDLAEIWLTGLTELEGMIKDPFATFMINMVSNPVLHLV